MLVQMQGICRKKGKLSVAWKLKKSQIYWIELGNINFDIFEDKVVLLDWPQVKKIARKKFDNLT